MRGGRTLLCGFRTGRLRHGFQRVPAGGSIFCTRLSPEAGQNPSSRCPGPDRRVQNPGFPTRPATTGQPHRGRNHGQIIGVRVPLRSPGGSTTGRQGRKRVTGPPNMQILSPCHHFIDMVRGLSRLKNYGLMPLSSLARIATPARRLHQPLLSATEGGVRTHNCTPIALSKPSITRVIKMDLKRYENAI